MEHDAQKMLSVLEERLSALESLMEKNPAVQKRMQSLIPLASSLQLQNSLLTKHKQRSKFILGSEMALIGIAEGKTGWIGPYFEKLIRHAVQSMIRLNPGTHPNTKEVLQSLLTTTTIGAVYLASQLLGGWEKIFSAFNQAEAKKSGALYQELSVLFIAATEAISKLYEATAKELGFNESMQKVTGNIAVAYHLLLAILSAERMTPEAVEYFETLQPHFLNTLDTFENVLNEAMETGSVETEQLSALSGHLQTLRISFEKGDPSTVRETITRVLETLGIPEEGFNNELADLIKTCSLIKDALEFAVIAVQTPRSGVVVTA